MTESFSNPKARTPLNPWWVTGFTECAAEGSFTISLQQSKTAQVGWALVSRFSIHLHKKDIGILYDIHNFFGVGNVYVSGKEAFFIVFALKDIMKIKGPPGATHFLTYPLRTSKHLNFLIFYQVMDLIESKTHSTLGGILHMAALINQLNTPLSLKLVAALGGSLAPVLLDLPPINTKPQLDPQWITGFVSGDGCFTVFTNKRITVSGETRLDFYPVFEVSQLAKDIFILEAIGEFFNMGKVYTYSRPKEVESKFRITGVDALARVIVPHFTSYPLCNVKQGQFLIWAEIVHILSTDRTWSKEREARVSALVKTLNAN